MLGEVVFFMLMLRTTIGRRTSQPPFGKRTRSLLRRFETLCRMSCDRRIWRTRSSRSPWAACWTGHGWIKAFGFRGLGYVRFRGLGYRVRGTDAALGASS